MATLERLRTLGYHPPTRGGVQLHRDKKELLVASGVQIHVSSVDGQRSRFLNAHDEALSCMVRKGCTGAAPATRGLGRSSAELL